MTKEYSFITTFHQPGYDLYGRNHVWYMDKALPEECSLHIYAEKTNVDLIGQTSDRVHYYDLDEVSPETQAYKDRNKDRQPGPQVSEKHRNGYWYEHIRFCHKVFAVLAHYHKHNDARYMVWCDADTLPVQSIPLDFLRTTLNEGDFMSILERGSKHAECGFMVWDTQHPQCEEYFRRIDRLVNNDELFDMYDGIGWHDSIYWDYTMRDMRKEGLIGVTNLSYPSPKTPHARIGSHPMVEGFLGEYLDHMKGSRKKRGFSQERQRVWGQ